MKKLEKMEYLTPEFNLLEVAVEQGFSVSDPYGRDYENGCDLI